MLQFKSLCVLFAALWLSTHALDSSAARRVHKEYRSGHLSPVKSKAVKTRAKARKKVVARVNESAQIEKRLWAQQEETGQLALRSAAALVIEQDSGRVLFARESDARHPIASITKLMTALVVLDARQSLDELLSISEADVDTLKSTHSRLKVGAQISRREMLHLALMASENRAAAALSRHYPGGRTAFVAAMNSKARELGMTRTRFLDPTGLSSENVSTASDLVRLVRAAHRQETIRAMSTAESFDLLAGNDALGFRNTNVLVRKGEWDIGLSKTGYISEAGHCLVMQARIAQKPVIIVLLDATGKVGRAGDANRIKRWMESGRHLAGRSPGRPGKA